MTETAPILVPLDGSDLAEQAIPVAAAIAQRWRAPLRLARVHVPLSSEVHCADGLVVIDDQRDLDARLSDAAYLDRQRERGGDVGAETVLLQGPAVAPALATDARRSGARLVVMATHARGGLRRLLLGSVAAGMVKRSPAPVLVVHPRHGAPPPRFRRVLVPLDEGDLARSILQHVPALAEPGAQVLLLHVIEPTSWAPVLDGVAPPETGQAVLEAEAWSRLEREAVPLRAQGFAVESRVSVSARCAREILATARGMDAELIAIATHGRSGLARAAFGSVADAVLRGAEMPVLLHHPVPADQARDARVDGETTCRA